MNDLARFFWERRGEIATLTAQHLALVVAAAAIAIAIGVPLGVVPDPASEGWRARSSRPPTSFRRYRAWRSSGS